MNEDKVDTPAASAAEQQPLSSIQRDRLKQIMQFNSQELKQVMMVAENRKRLEGLANQNKDKKSGVIELETSSDEDVIYEPNGVSSETKEFSFSEPTLICPNFKRNESFQRSKTKHSPKMGIEPTSSEGNKPSSSKQTGSSTTSIIQVIDLTSEKRKKKKRKKKSHSLNASILDKSENRDNEKQEKIDKNVQKEMIPKPTASSSNAKLLNDKMEKKKKRKRSHSLNASILDKSEYRDNEKQEKMAHKNVQKEMHTTISKPTSSSSNAKLLNDKMEKKMKSKKQRDKRHHLVKSSPIINLEESNSKSDFDFSLTESIQETTSFTSASIASSFDSFNRKLSKKPSNISSISLLTSRKNDMFMDSSDADDSLDETPDEMKILKGIRQSMKKTNFDSISNSLSKKPKKMKELNCTPLTTSIVPSTDYDLNFDDDFSDDSMLSCPIPPEMPQDKMKDMMMDNNNAHVDNNNNEHEINSPMPMKTTEANNGENDFFDEEQLSILDLEELERTAKRVTLSEFEKFIGLSPMSSNQLESPPSPLRQQPDSTFDPKPSKLKQTNLFQFGFSVKKSALPSFTTNKSKNLDNLK